MRILYVVNVMGRGGVEIQLRDRAANLVRRGHSVAVVSIYPFLDFEDWLSKAGVTTVSLGLRGRASAPAALAAYARALRKFRPDVVHSHLFGASMLARLGRLMPRTIRGPIQAVVCSSHAQKENHPRRYAAYRITASLGDVWTSASREGIRVHEAHRAVAAGSAVWMPNGVDLQQYRPDRTMRAETRAEHRVDEGAFFWLALGSFRDETKDFPTLFSAFQRLPASSVLVIAGEGRFLEQKRALAHALKIGDRVRFLGLRTDVDRLLQAADGFVLSSQSEAMPNVLLQASATCLPIVTTDVGEATSIVLDEVTGYVVPPRNAVRLAEALQRVEALHPEARERLGQAGRAHVTANFDFERVVDRWESMYEGLVTGKGAAIR